MKLRHIIFGLVLIISSCTTKQDSQNIIPINKIEQNSEIRFIGQWMNEGKRGDLVRNFCRNYEFKNQHLIVNLKFPEETLENHKDRASNVRFVANQLYRSDPEWDVIRLNNQIYAITTETGDPNWVKENLVDFSQFPEFRENTLPKLLTQESKNNYGGIIPGPFLEGSYWALFTNTEVTNKIGIKVKNIGMTIDDFTGYLKALHTYNKNNPSDYIIPIHESGNWMTTFALSFQLFASALNNNTELFNPVLTENKLIAWEETLRALEELSKFEPLDDNYQSRLWEDSNGDLLDEKCLFYINGSWMYNIWEDKDNEKLKNIMPAELPVFQPLDLYPTAYFITWAVLKNSPNRDEAVKFLLSLNQPEVADEWIQMTKSPTGIIGRMSDANFGTDVFETYARHVQEKYANNNYNFGEELSQYAIGEMSAENTHYKTVLEGTITTDEAMLKIRERIKLLNMAIN